VAASSGALVTRGIGPADKASQKAAKKMIELANKVTDVRGVIITDRRAFANNWWKVTLYSHDFMPKCASPPSQP
jgi:hypothetical protein